MQKLRGKVIWYSATKGFGFISRPDGPDCFLHQAALHGRKPLRDGAEVEFDLSGTDGVHVDNVSPIGTALDLPAAPRAHRKPPQSQRPEAQTPTAAVPQVPLAAR